LNGQGSVRLLYQLPILLCPGMGMATRLSLRQSVELRGRQVVRLITRCVLYLFPGLFLIVILSQLTLEPSSGTRWIKVPDLQIISSEVVRQHFAAVIGLPASAILALWIVTLLRSQSGPIEFETAGFKFRGASGPVILWVLCFLAIAVAVRLLW